MEERQRKTPDTLADQRLQAWVLAGGVLIMAVKLYGWWITDSNAILSDALESFVNIGAGSFSLFALWWASQPRDRDHPYGHGKVEFLSALVEGVLILVAGGGIAVKSGYNLFYPLELRALDTGLILAAFGGLANYGMGWVMVRSGRKRNSLALEAEGRHLKSDAYSSAGLVLGVGIVLLTGWWWMDNVLGLAFGVMIAVTGVRLIRRSTAGILDEADDAALEAIRKKLNELRKPQWIDVHNMRLIRYGRAWHVDAHLTLPWYWDLRRGHDEAEELDLAMNRALDQDVEFFIHLDPCLPSSCPLCTVDCPHRQSPFERKLEWTQDSLRSNRRHGR